jgi:hypothetical protein
MDVDGLAVSLGLADLRTLPLSRFVNFIWWYLTRNIQSEADLAKIRANVWMPPAGVEPTEGPWSAAAEMSAFASLKASLGQ